MIEVQNPYKKEALIKALENTHTELTDYFASLSVDAFFKKPPDKWSPAENLIHLIKSIKAVSLGLRLPKIILRFKFGRSRHDSRLYPKIREAYLNKLADGATSPKQFEPDDRELPSDPNLLREQILKKWNEVNDKLIGVFARWKEQDLDRYVLPHPILGNLNIREMMMFTIYHSIHHLTVVQKSLDEKQVKGNTLYS